MSRLVAQILGIVVATLAVVGLLTNGHIFGLINGDLTMDLLRIPLAAALLYAGFGTHYAPTVRSVLMFTGVAYVGLALLGLIDATLWGLLPSGLTGFDIVFHLATGILAVVAARSTHHYIATARG
jgi:hypothetical protein